MRTAENVERVANDKKRASTVRAVFGLLLPVLSFIKNFADSVTVHAHEYAYISILLSSTFT